MSSTLVMNLKKKLSAGMADQFRYKNRNPHCSGEGENRNEARAGVRLGGL